MDKADYRKEVTEELSSILRYWMEKMPDERRGGFFGRVDGDDHVHADAPKGLVLNSRICWAFSAGYLATGEDAYRNMARRACDYLLGYFLDRQYGGAYWSLAADGQAPGRTQADLWAGFLSVRA